MNARVQNFSVVHFKAPDPVTKEPREVILLYALGADGVIYEFNGEWQALPIDPERVKTHWLPPQRQSTNS